MTSTDTKPNVDEREIAKFAELANRWWDPTSEFKPLHDINPLRASWIEQRAMIAGRQLLDVGCGGGLLSEAMAHRGATVTGIDMGEVALGVARLHLLESSLEIDYRQMTAEELATAKPGSFDIVTCLEVLEHVPDPASVVTACAGLVRPGGDLFFSTINRNPKAWLFAIVGAEYALGLLPRGTHDYRTFIRPSELAAWLREAGLELAGITGMNYNLITRQYRLGHNVNVNYLIHAKRPAEH